MAEVPVGAGADTLTAAPSIDKLRRRFDEARTTLSTSRIAAMKRRDYYDGPGQLDSAVRRMLLNRGQPPIYTNRIRPAVNGILGVLEGGRTDPRAYGRNPDDDNAADVATKTLRFIADQSRFADIKQDVAENFLIEGTGGSIVEVIDGKIVPTQIRFEEFYYDPYSRRPDLEDARYMGIAKWKDADEITQKYRVRIDEIGDPLAAGMGWDAQYDDRPNNLGWVDPRRRRVMTVEEYAVEGREWKRVVYIGAGVLEYGTSPYLECLEGGRTRPCNPIVAQSCYVDRQNTRYSPVSDMIPIQDEVNASRSRSLHLMNMNQIQCIDPTAPPVDTETVLSEAGKADGVIPVGWQIVDHREMTQANMLRMQEAKSEIERMAPTPQARDLEKGSAVSGRARLVSQQAGMNEIARPLGRLSSWELRVYRQMWFRAKQYWTDEMYVRVTDDVNAPEYLKVNEPVMGMVMQPVMGPDGQPVINPITGTPAMQPAMGVTGHKNRLAEMDVDIILDSVPDTVSLEQETWGELRELATTFASMGLSIFSPEFELMLEASPLSDKARIIERLKKAREQGQEQQQQQAAKVAQAEEEARHLAIAEGAAKVRETNTKADLNEINATKIAAETMQGLHERINSPPENSEAGA